MQPTEVMAIHYLRAARWTEEEQLNGATEPGITTVDDARNECADFLNRARPALKQAGNIKGYGSHPDCGTEHPIFAALGHDLWLTRNGHGCGFWDRPELCAVTLPDGSNLGEALSNIACAMGSQDIYVGDDGLVYLS